MAYQDLSIISGLIARFRGRAFLWETTTAGNGTWVGGLYTSAVPDSGPRYGIISQTNILKARTASGTIDASAKQFFTGQKYQFLIILGGWNASQQAWDGVSPGYEYGARIFMRGYVDYKVWTEVWVDKTNNAGLYFGHNALNVPLLIDNIYALEDDFSAFLINTPTTQFSRYLSPPATSDIFIVDNPAMPLGYSGFPGVIKLSDGTLICVYRNGSGHGGTDGVIKIRTSSDNGLTWSAATTAYDDVTYDVRDPSITRLSNGGLIMTYFTDERPASPSHRVWVIKSVDDGETWGTPIEVVPPSLTDMRAVSAPVVQLTNGDLVIAIYGFQSGGTKYTAITMKSSDGGDTWNSEAIIAQPGALSYSEPNILLLDSGNLLALIRSNSDNTIHKSISDDSGGSWSSETSAFAGKGSPHMIQLSDGRVLATTRHTDEKAIYRLSSDLGTTWGDPVTIHNFERYSMQYASPLELSPTQVGVAYGVQSTAYTIDSDILFRMLSL